jgi:hypothetical protein
MVRQGRAWLQVLPLPVLATWYSAAAAIDRMKQKTRKNKKRRCIFNRVFINSTFH